VAHKGKVQSTFNIESVHSIRICNVPVFIRTISLLPRCKILKNSIIATLLHISSVIRLVHLHRKEVQWDTSRLQKQRLNLRKLGETQQTVSGLLCLHMCSNKVHKCLVEEKIKAARRKLIQTY